MQSWPWLWRSRGLPWRSHPQRVLSRDQLLDMARGRNAESYDRAIDTHISRLRRKLNDRSNSELIRTVRNEGYMLLPKVTRT